MTPEQFTELKEALAQTVQVSVNGKIDRLNTKLDTHIDGFNRYVKDDMEWKETVEPVVKAFENTSWLWKLFIGILKFLGLVSVGIGAWMTIKQILFK